MGLCPGGVLIVSALSAAALLNVCLVGSPSLAQERNVVRSQAPQKASGAGHARSRAAAPRITARRALSRTKRVVTIRHAPKSTTLRRTTKHVARKAPSVVPRMQRQAIRKLPTNLALVNKGLRQSPGRSKPASVMHDAKHKAGKSGWTHRHQPFVFKHDGHRWRRHYYTFLVGGLWYWYWYDVIADDDPAALVYDEGILPDCSLDIDECTEAGTIIAPAILEGRATEEAMARCRAEFRSFDTRTGTYVMYGGSVRVCPYLE
jgi:BA14K-like protein